MSEPSSVEGRVEDLEARVETAELKVDAQEERVVATEVRLEVLAAKVDIDHVILLELQAEGVISREHAANLEEALRSSRTIGAAMGIIMTTTKVDQDDAFALLVRASQNTNTKVRALADELVRTRDVRQLINSGGPST